MMKHQRIWPVIGVAGGMLVSGVIADTRGAKPPVSAAESKPIKSYCLDFNWEGQGRRKSLARPGTWKSADPAAHVAWYKAMGANVIQTFCVSTGGYAWYKNGFVPEQPGLQHDFLPEVVKLGHKEGMQVFGYFTIACNPRWGAEHPELSYGTPSTYHIPYTDEYLDFLAKSVSDAVKKTGIDGFMMDWLWMPGRESTKGKWLDCEKKLYQQLMGEPFPGEEQVGEKSEKYTDFSRKALDRCWKTIRKAAKEANPNCIIWLTVNAINHPHVVNSDIYKETADGLIPLEGIFKRQVCELSGDARNIAVLARAYHGKSVDALWQDGTFVEPAKPPPFHIALKGRGRGGQDTASITHEKDVASVTITTTEEQ